MLEENTRLNAEHGRVINIATGLNIPETKVLFRLELVRLLVSKLFQKQVYWSIGLVLKTVPDMKFNILRDRDILTVTLMKSKAKLFRRISVMLK